jgi:hypothetical protein
MVRVFPLLDDRSWSSSPRSLCPRRGETFLSAYLHRAESPFFPSYFNVIPQTASTLLNSKTSNTFGTLLYPDLSLLFVNPVMNYSDASKSRLASTANVMIDPKCTEPPLYNSEPENDSPFSNSESYEMMQRKEARLGFDKFDWISPRKEFL